MSVDVKKSIAALALAGAIGGGLFEGTKPVEPIDTVAAVNEIVAERTELTRVYDAGLDTSMVAGKQVVRQKRMAVVTGQPMHWKDEDGTYKAIDTTVQKRALLTAVLSKYEYETAFTGETSALFDKDSDSDYAVTRGDRSIEYTLLSDTTGVDVTTETTTRGVKQTYTLRNAKASSTLRWFIDTDAEMTREGDGFVFRDGGKFLWRIKPPKAWDAKGKALNVTVTAQGDTLTWAVDVAGAEYPVTVDPTTVINDTDNTTGTLNRWNVTTSYSDARTNEAANDYPSGAIEVGQSIGSTYSNRRGALYFDTSSLPDNAVIDSAYIKLRLSNKINHADGDSVVLVQGTFSGTIMDSLWYKGFSGWASGEDAYTVTPLSIKFNPYSYSKGDTITLHFNTSGLTSISKTSASKFMLLANNDITNTNGLKLNAYSVYGDDDLYMTVYYTPSTSPTDFTLTVMTATSITASWTNTVTNDSLLIMNSPENTGVVYADNPNDTSKLVTGLAPNALYTFFARADSGGIKGDSNSDSLYTLSAEPSGVAVSSVAHTSLALTWTANGNPDSTLYAIQVYNVTDDSTYYWTGAALAATATWKTRPAWTLPESITGLTIDTNYRIGVQSKNGDGVTAAYVYAYARTAEFTQSVTVPIATMYGHRTIDTINNSYFSARSETSIDSIFTITSGANGWLGQYYSSSKYVNYRISITAYIPDINYDAFKLHLIGTSDNSTTNFNIVGKIGKLYGVVPDSTHKRYYYFDGWYAGSATYGGYDMFTPVNTSGWSSSGDNIITFNITGLGEVAGAKGDTLRMVLLSEEDQNYSIPTNFEYVSANLSTSYFSGEYEYTEAAPYGVTATPLGSTSVIVTWNDSTLTNTGFLIVDEDTGAALSDTLAYNAEADTLSGLIPNTIYRLRVKIIGGNKDGTLSTTYTLCTLPGTPGTPVITDLGDGLVKVVIDTTGAKNPGDTEYALMFITSGNDSLWAVADTLNTATHDENSSWGWKTYANWGGANGDSIQAQAGRNYTIKAIARTREY